MKRRGRWISRVVGALAALGVVSTAGADDPPSAQPPATVSRALVIGVESYSGDLGWTALTGPVADAQSMAEVLIERGGFRAEHVTILLDQEATRVGILAALDALVQRADDGDLLLVYFAGHGSQLLDDDGDEFDGRDETIVPIDPMGLDGARQDIRDDELAAFIKAANRVTDNVVLVFDCCSSGTNVRGGDEPVSRRAPAEAQHTGVGVSADPGSEGVGAGAAGGEGRDPGEAQDTSGYLEGFLDGPMSYVALSACRSTQSAYELPVEEAPGLAREGGGASPEEAPLRRGIFTSVLVQELRHHRAGDSYRDLLDRVRFEVRRRIPVQTPVIEGPLDRWALFGGRAVVQEPYVFLWKGRAGWQLEAGRLSGITEGAEFVACDGRASRPDAERRLGWVRVTSLGTTSSSVEWIDGEPPLLGVNLPLRSFAAGAEPQPGALAVAVDATGDDESEVALAALLKQHRSVRIVPLGEQGALTVAAGPDRVWRARRPDGLPLPLRAPMDDGVQVAALADDLAHLGRATVLRHAWSDRTGELPVSWSLQLYEEKGDRVAPLPGGRYTSGDETVTVQPGDHFAMRLRNDSSVAVWATLVVVAPDGEVGVLISSAEDEPLQPGDYLERSASFTLPDGSVPYFEGRSQRLAWIVTRRYHDLGAHAQPALLDRRPAGQLRGGSIGRSKSAPIARDAAAIVGIEVEVLPRRP